MSCKNCNCFKCRKLREKKQLPQTKKQLETNARLSHACGVLFKKIAQDFDRLAQAQK